MANQRAIVLNAQAARLAGRAGRACNLLLVSANRSKNVKHASRPNAGTIITNAVVGVVVGMLATFGAPGVGACQRAVGEGSPERGEQAKPRWSGAQGAG